MPKWTTDQIPDQSGRVAIVTGANSGLGREVARGSARKGAEVILACRNTQKGEAARAEVADAATGAAPRLEALDLADLESVRAFAARAPKRVDLLINNAGIMAPPYAKTVDGFESQLGTNHLGHFALTGLLLPSLLAAPAPRVVSTSSVAHRTGSIDFDDLHSEKRHSRWGAYGQSKLANLLFTLELQRRFEEAGSPAIAVAAHPGYSATNLQFASPPLHERVVMKALNVVIAQSASAGARPLLLAATGPDVAGDDYYGPDGPFEGRGNPKKVGRSGAARDAGVARRLWEVSEELTGVSYDLGTKVAG